MPDSGKQKTNMVVVKMKPVSSTENANEGTETENYIEIDEALWKRASDLQREVIPLSFDDFVSETNIAELIKVRHRKLYSTEISMEELDEDLKLCYDLRLQVNKWQRSVMKNLQFNICDCKRNKVHKGTQASGLDLITKLPQSPIVGSSTTQLSPNSIRIADDTLQSSTSADTVHNTPHIGEIKEETIHADGNNENRDSDNMNNLSSAGAASESSDDETYFDILQKQLNAKLSANQQSTSTATGRNKPNRQS